MAKKNRIEILRTKASELATFARTSGLLKPSEGIAISVEIALTPTPEPSISVKEGSHKRAKPVEEGLSDSDWSKILSATLHPEARRVLVYLHKNANQPQDARDLGFDRYGPFSAVSTALRVAGLPFRLMNDPKEDPSWPFRKVRVYRITW